jgi:hypothetical protein
MTAIKLSVQQQTTHSAIPMGRALQQWQFWLSRLLLVKTDNILQFSPKLSLKLEYMVRRILIQRNKEKRGDNEQDRGNESDLTLLVNWRKI